MILNVLLMVMFIGLPAIWTSMMGWLSYRMGTGSEYLSGANRLASGAATATKSGGKSRLKRK